MLCETYLPAGFLMMRSVIVEVASLAHSLEVCLVAVLGRVVEVSGGQNHLRPGSVRGFPMMIATAAIGTEMRRSAAALARALAPSTCPDDLDVVSDRRPVLRVAIAVLWPNRHHSTFGERDDCPGGIADTDHRDAGSERCHRRPRGFGKPVDRYLVGAGRELASMEVPADPGDVRSGPAVVVTSQHVQVRTVRHHTSCGGTRRRLILLRQRPVGKSEGPHCPVVGGCGEVPPRADGERSYVLRQSLITAVVAGYQV